MATWHGFTVVDGLFGLLLLAGFAGGVRRGLSGELVRAIIAVSAVVAAILYARPVSEWAMARWHLEVRPAIIGAFLLVMLGLYAAVTMLRVLLGRLADFTFKGKLERLGGGLCGLVRAGAVTSLIILLLGMAPNENLHRVVIDESVIGRLVTQHLRPVYDQLSERVPEIRVPHPVEDVDPLYEIPAELMEDAPAVDDVKDLEPGEVR